MIVSPWADCNAIDTPLMSIRRYVMGLYAFTIAEVYQMHLKHFPKPSAQTVVVVLRLARKETTSF